MKVCRNINEIKNCMEAGRTVVLLNLENLYESLYDALNQVCVTLLCVDSAGFMLIVKISTSKSRACVCVKIYLLSFSFCIVHDEHECYNVSDVHAF